RALSPAPGRGRQPRCCPRAATAPQPGTTALPACKASMETGEEADSVTLLQPCEEVHRSPANEGRPERLIHGRSNGWVGRSSQGRRRRWAAVLGETSAHNRQIQHLQDWKGVVWPALRTASVPLLAAYSGYA